MATHSSILAWKDSTGSSPWGRGEWDMTERLMAQHGGWGWGCVLGAGVLILSRVS